MDFINIVVGALVGAGAAYVFDIRKAQADRRADQAENARERRRNRDSVATALLIDVKRLEFELHQLFASKTPSLAAVRHPDLFYDTLRSEVRWFASPSIQSVAEFFRQAEFVFTTLQVMRDKNLGGSRDEAREYHLRCLCAFALQRLPAAAKALRAEGGVAPVSESYPTVTFPELPQTPERLFADQPLPSLNS